MTQAELRAKIRELMASGILPSERPSIERRGSPEDWAQIGVRNPLPPPCSICGEPSPQIALFYAAGLVVRLHAACEAAWKLERGAMTKADFLKALEEHDEVKFPGSTLRAPTFRVGDLLCDALTTVLPQGEIIRFGVQLSTFPEPPASHGQLLWLLLLRARLLEVVCTVSGDEKGAPAAVPVVARMHPIDGATQVESTLEYSGLPVTTRPLSVGARIGLGAVTFEIRADRHLLLTNEGVGAFIAALLESASR